MPASAVYAATDPCEYGAVIRGADVNVLINGRGNFRAKVTRIDLHKMWLQRGQENLPRIFRSTPPENRVVVSFVTEESSPVIRLGSEVSPQQIIIMSPGRLSTWRSLGAARWCAMSLPTEDFLFWGRALTGRDVMPQELQQIITPSLPLMSRLQELHRLAGHLAETAPGVIAATEAASGLEQSLIEAMFACIGTEAVQDLATARRHGEIMRRFEAVLESNPDRRFVLAGDLRRYRRAGTDIAGLLHRVPGHGPQAISAPAAHAHGAPDAPPGRPGLGHSDRNRDPLRLLGTRPLRRRIPVAV